MAANLSADASLGSTNTPDLGDGALHSYGEGGQTDKARLTSQGARQGQDADEAFPKVWPESEAFKAAFENHALALEPTG